MHNSPREVRLRIRLAFLSVWRAHLEALPPYDPAYACDERYDHEDDWTSDPDYRGSVPHFRAYSPRRWARATAASRSAAARSR